MKKTFLALMLFGTLTLAGCAAQNEPVNLSLGIETPSDPGIMIADEAEGEVDSEGEVEDGFEFDPTVMPTFEHSLYTLNYPGRYTANELEKDWAVFEDEDGVSWMRVAVAEGETPDSYQFYEKIKDVTYANSEGTLWMGQGYCDGPAADENCADARIMYVAYDGVRSYEITLIGMAEEDEVAQIIFDSFTLVPQA